MGCRVASIIVFGLLLHCWTGCNPQAQLFGRGLLGGGQGGSASNANSAAFSRNVGIGNLGGINTSGTRSQSVTRQGGSVDVANSNSFSKGVNIGNLGVSSTLTSSKSYSNTKGVSGGVEHDLNIGKLGIGSSVSKENLKNGIGLRKNENGGVSLGLGLLDFDIGRNQQNSVGGAQAQTNAGAFANGPGGRANAQSNSASNNRKVGIFDISSSLSNSQANALSRNGQTGAYANGQANAAQSNVGRFKRQDVFFPDDEHGPVFEQQSAANTQTETKGNAHGIFQNTAGSSQSSNLANDGSAGQLSSANTMQQNFHTHGQAGNKNSAQSQSLNFGKDNVDASSANADTSHIKGPNSEVIEANSGSQSNQQNQFGSAANSAQTNTKVFNEGGRRGSESSGHSQSIVNGPHGGQSASNSASKAQSSQGPGGFFSSSASSSSSSSSGGRGGQSGTSSSSSSNSGSAGSNSFSSANSNSFGGGGGGFGGGGFGRGSGGPGGFGRPHRGHHGGFPEERIALVLHQEQKYIERIKRDSTSTKNSLQTSRDVVLLQRYGENGPRLANQTYETQPRTFDTIFNFITNLIAPTSTLSPCFFYPCQPVLPPVIPPCGGYPCSPGIYPPGRLPIPQPIPVPNLPRYPFPCCTSCLYPCGRPPYYPYPYPGGVIIGGINPTRPGNSIFGFGNTAQNIGNNIYGQGVNSIGNLYGQGTNAFQNVGQFALGYYRAGNYSAIVTTEATPLQIKVKKS